MVCAQARILLEDPTAEEHILQHWNTLLPEALQKWQLRPDLLSAFSDGYRNASLIKDRVRPSAPGPAADVRGIGWWQREHENMIPSAALRPCTVLAHT